MKKALIDWIEQYHFGEKFELNEPPGLASLWVLGTESDGGSKAWTTELREGLRACYAGADDYGRSLLTLWGQPAGLDAWLNDHLPDAREEKLETLEAWRIEALSPRSGHELGPESSPLEAGFKRAIAMNKGCYPGQEVIEKTIALGTPARRLCRLQGKGPAPKSGTLVTNQAEPPAEVGRVTSAVAAGEGFQALAFIRKIHAKQGLEVRLGDSGSLARIAAVSSFTSP